MVSASAKVMSLAILGLGRVAGPIFDKELRVASRRVRYYALRTAYAGALTFLILATWNAGVHSGPAVVRASRMFEVAMAVTTGVTWLQFLAAQGLAAILLSSAIGEEVRKGTLSALLTTPISSFQIVVGKLLSRMLQVFVSLAISLPALAILRLLGGVPWDYILAGGCLTVTTTLFVGALSLWLSTHCRYGSQVISITLLLLLVLFVISPPVVSWLASEGMLNRTVAASIMGLTNPFYVLYHATVGLWSPAGPVPWALNSLVMLGLTLVLLALTVRRVRRVAVAGAVGSGKSAKAVAVRAVKGLLWSRGAIAAAPGPVRRVEGSPVVWKETRRGLRYGWSVTDVVICVIVLTAALAVLGSALVLEIIDAEAAMGTGLFFAWFLSLLVLIRLVVECAGSVPRERESRTWPILLTTLLEDREIVYGKAKAALLHNGPLLITLAAIYVLFLAVFPRAETLLGAGLSLASQVVSILLVIGVGSYFGVTVKTRASAIVATIVVCLAMKYSIGGIFTFVAAGLIMGPGGRVGPAQWGIPLVMIIPAAIEVTIAVTAIRVAAQRVRHDVF